MSTPILDEHLFRDFSEHLSASLNVVDILYKLRQLALPNFDPNEDDPISLAVWDQSMIGRLIEMDYTALLTACVGNFRLLESCADVFLSEIEQNMVDLFRDVFQHIASLSKVEVTDRGFIVHAPAILADLILPPLGRMHYEALQSLDHFSQMLAAVDNDPKKLFLNAKAPTPESQYIQIWVASKLEIPIAPPSGNIMVV